MKRIMLVEPDRVLVKTYTTLFESAGYKVEWASTAQDAINMADKKKPDLVIVEIQLVSHSGIEFLYEFRSYSEWQKIPVIILTMVPPQEFEDNWQLVKKELNIAGYFYKQTTKVEKLLQEINKLIK